MLGLALPVGAQWKSTSYALKGGWNAIYLYGDATHVTPDQLFNAGDGLQVEEVWRWNPNPSQVQFTSDPFNPTPGTPEWSTWYRTPPGGVQGTLSTMDGQAAYLVKCSGTAADSYTVTIPQRILPPRATWVRNGANLLGFPVAASPSPSFSNYFATFPAAIAAGSKIYRYVGGPLGAGNPLQLFDPTIESVTQGQAYWFEAQAVGNFYAPAQISLSVASGLDFGRTGSVITALVHNRSSAPMTLTIAPVASSAAPAGQQAITGPVPLTRRVFNATTASWEETPLTAFNQVIAPQSAVELSFGIDRVAMTGAPDAFFASMLGFTDATNLFDILIPATARKSSLAGLWIGEALVSAVESKPAADAVTPVGRAFPLRYLLHVADDGTARVLSQAFTGTLAAGTHPFGICTKEIGLKADAKAGAARFVATHLPLDRVIEAGTLTSLGTTLSCNVDIPFDDPVNPFAHRYHPDHDNMDARGNALTAGKESYTVSRALDFTFTATPPAGVSPTGWGSSVIGGDYAETISGVHKQAVSVAGTFTLRRVSEIGDITVNN